ncbi:dolichol kinase [Sorochytrium milnesiophthora]
MPSCIQRLAAFLRSSARVEQAALLLAVFGIGSPAAAPLARSPPLTLSVWSLLCSAADCLLPFRPFADGTRRAMTNDVLWAGGVMTALAWRLYALPRSGNSLIAGGGASLLVGHRHPALVILAMPFAALAGVAIVAAVKTGQNPGRSHITATSRWAPRLSFVMSRVSDAHSTRAIYVAGLFLARILIPPTPLVAADGTVPHLATLGAWVSSLLTPALAAAVAPSLILTFRLSFSLAEACIIASALAIFAHFGSILLWTTAPLSASGTPSALPLVTPTFLFVHALVLGMALILLLATPLLTKLRYLAKGKQKENDHTRQRMSLAVQFYALAAAIVVGIITPTVWWKLGENPWVWMINFIVGSRRTLHLFGLWSALLAGACFVFPWGAPLNTQRKFYHLLATLIMTPGFVLAPHFLTIATAFVFALFIFVEMLRYARIPPFGDFLHTQLAAFSDDRDEGEIITSHMYLLLGMAMPVWLVVAERGSGAQAMIAGVSGMMTLGLGDTLASILGKALRGPRWPESRKTFIGTCGFVLGCGLYLSGVVIALSASTYNGWLSPETLDRFMSELGVSAHPLGVTSTENVRRLFSTVLLTAIVESTTTQFDNLFIPLFTMLMLL